MTNKENGIQDKPEAKVKNKTICFTLAVLLAVLLAACAGEKPPPPAEEIIAQTLEPAETLRKADILADLDRIAEIERGGAFFPGLAIAESNIREKAGDLAGAAVAAYKELSWAYGYGSVARGQIEEGLQRALALLEDDLLTAQSEKKAAFAALRGCIAFAREDWSMAEELLSGCLNEGEDADSFLRWMLLVCALEQKNGNPEVYRDIRSAYGIIRARYALFPEYWYRGARAFSSGEGTLADDAITTAFAEQCINASPKGPFSGDCRKILAAHAGLTGYGLSSETECDFADIRTKAEIENAIRSSVSMNDPSILEDLFPLIALPENPYTIYALGAMKSLSRVPEFRQYFSDLAANSSGRLGERLNYISRG